MSVGIAVVGAGGPSDQIVTKAWAADTQYRRGTQVGQDGTWYLCIQNHVSAAATQPGTGADWTDCWVQQIPPFAVDIWADQLELDFQPVHFTPRVTVSANKVNQLAALIAGIDDKLGYILGKLPD